MATAGDPRHNDTWVLSVACSHPTSPVARQPVRFGNQTGIALTDEGAGGNAVTNTTVDFGPWVKYLSVKGVNQDGNSAVAAGDAIYYVDADTPPLSKKNTGRLFGIALEGVGSGSTGTIQVWHLPSPGVGATFPGTGDINASMLSETLKTGFIPLDLNSLRIIATNAIGNTLDGIIPDGNTTPLLSRVNGATDKALRIVWAAGVTNEVQFGPVPKPPDLDGAADLTVHLMLAKNTNTDDAVTIDVQIFDGVGDTEAGEATAALDAAALAEYTASIDAADLAAAPGFINVALIPGTHAADAIYLYAAWITYTRA